MRVAGAMAVTAAAPSSWPGVLRARAPLGPTQMATGTSDPWMASARRAMRSGETTAPLLLSWITSACAPPAAARSMAFSTSSVTTPSTRPLISMMSTGGSAPWPCA